MRKVLKDFEPLQLSISLFGTAGFIGTIAMERIEYASDNIRTAALIGSGVCAKGGVMSSVIKELGRDISQPVRNQ